MVTTWQAQRARAQEAIAIAEKARAEHRFNEVRQLARSVIFDYHDAIRDLSGATAIRERLVKDGLAYLDSLASEAGDDPELQRELAAAYDRVGDVRGENYFRRESRRLRRGHGELYQGAAEFAKRWWLPRPGTCRIAATWPPAITRSGCSCSRRARPRAAWSICARESRSTSSLPPISRRTWKSGRTWRPRTTRSGWRWKSSGNPAGALEIHRKALALREALVAADPGNQKLRRSLVITDINLGRALVLSGDFQGRPCEQSQGAGDLRSAGGRKSQQRRLPAVAGQHLPE